VQSLARGLPMDATTKMNSIMDWGTTQQALLTILNLVIVALVSALTALGVSYFRTRGQNLATKRDFDELSKQLRANTELVETIKSEVSQRDWAQREWTNLRRIKLEALLDKMHECETYLDRARSEALGGKSERGPDVMNEFVTISTLYFPELKKEADEFYFGCKELIIKILDLAQAIHKAGNDLAARQSAYDDFQIHWPPERLVLARFALRSAARSLLERIMNVDESAASNDER
jgi:hypothetical protein